MANNKKGRYSLASNIAFSARRTWRQSRSLVIWAGVGAVMAALAPFAEILLPKLVIDGITQGWGMGRFCLSVGGLALGIVGLTMLRQYPYVLIDEEMGSTGISIAIRSSVDKYLDVDYELMGDPDFKRVAEKAARAEMSNHAPGMNMLKYLCNLITNSLGFLLYGGVIASIHPVMLLLLAVTAAINWAMLSFVRRYEASRREVRSDLFGKLDAVVSCMQSVAGAKDIRIYSQLGWLKDIANSLFGQKAREDDKVANRQVAAGLVEALLILVRDGAAYGFLITLLLRGELSLGNFTVAFAAIGAFAGWLSGILVEASNLLRSSTEVSDLRAFYDYPNRSNTGHGAALPVSLPPGLTLEHVSYAYPGAESPALEDVSLTIRPGERIAIVGQNGAGKTTLVNLLCGLLRPSEGAVFLGGRDIREYNRDEYFSLFSAVFQDIYLLSTSVAGNVAQEPLEALDRDRASRCLELAGLSGKVAALPQGMDTMLVREINSDAVELSGGELQRLALARALYKDAPVILLDEPTAALDPIAENNIYRQYAELTQGKTSVYISHRLASTRFCDRILLVADRGIAEEGSHEELMARGGKYAEMFAIQAAYYGDGEVTLYDKAN